MSVETASVATAVGTIRVIAVDDVLTHVTFDDSADAAPQPPTGAVVGDACRQLEQYFARERREFSLPLAPRGTDFQLLVWRQLQQIPYGRTVCYGDVAAALGLPPGGSRAVGLANGANPLAIVVPCHRVIGADGSLVGYGGGLWRKRVLLDLESRVSQPSLFDT